VHVREGEGVRSQRFRNAAKAVSGFIGWLASKTGMI
jgi:hypothetical protein